MTIAPSWVRTSLAVALAVNYSLAGAADLPLPPKTAPPVVAPAIPLPPSAPAQRPAAPATSPSLAPNFDPTCRAWGDGCRTCLRTADGVTCSNPGIACQPREDLCTQR